MKPRHRRQDHYWKKFNAWWRNYKEETGQRPTTSEIRQWVCSPEGLSAWPADDRPSEEEAIAHSKGMRSLAEVRAYFKRYRRQKAAAQTGGCMTDTSSENDDAQHIQPVGVGSQGHGRAAQTALADPAAGFQGVNPAPADVVDGASVAPAVAQDAAAALAASAGAEAIGARGDTCDCNGVGKQDTVAIKEEQQDLQANIGAVAATATTTKGYSGTVPQPSRAAGAAARRRRCTAAACNGATPQPLPTPRQLSLSAAPGILVSPGQMQALTVMAAAFACPPDGAAATAATIAAAQVTAYESSSDLLGPNLGLGTGGNPGLGVAAQLKLLQTHGANAAGCPLRRACSSHVAARLADPLAEGSQLPLASGACNSTLRSGASAHPGFASPASGMGQHVRVPMAVLDPNTILHDDGREGDPKGAAATADDGPSWGAKGRRGRRGRRAGSARAKCNSYTTSAQLQQQKPRAASSVLGVLGPAIQPQRQQAQAPAPTKQSQGLQPLVLGQLPVGGKAPPAAGIRDVMFGGNGAWQLYEAMPLQPLQQLASPCGSAGISIKRHPAETQARSQNKRPGEEQHGEEPVNMAAHVKKHRSGSGSGGNGKGGGRGGGGDDQGGFGSAPGGHAHSYYGSIYGAEWQGGSLGLGFGSAGGYLHGGPGDFGPLAAPVNSVVPKHVQHAWLGQDLQLLQLQQLAAMSNMNVEQLQQMQQLQLEEGQLQGAHEETPHQQETYEGEQGEGPEGEGPIEQLLHQQEGREPPFTFQAGQERQWSKPGAFTHAARPAALTDAASAAAPGINGPPLAPLMRFQNAWTSRPTASPLHQHPRVQQLLLHPLEGEDPDLLDDLSEIFEDAMEANPAPHLAQVHDSASAVLPPTRYTVAAPDMYGINADAQFAAVAFDDYQNPFLLYYTDQDPQDPQPLQRQQHQQLQPHVGEQQPARSIMEDRDVNEAAHTLVRALSGDADGLFVPAPRGIASSAKKARVLMVSPLPLHRSAKAVACIGAGLQGTAALAAAADSPSAAATATATAGPEPKTDAAWARRRAAAARKSMGTELLDLWLRDPQVLQPLDTQFDEQQ